MFAYVRYIDDNIRQIVPLDYIKDFCPQDVNDFEIKKKYHILWKKSPEDQGQYYKAQILKLAESEEELTRERISIPPLDSDEEDCSSYKNSMNPSDLGHGVMISTEKWDIVRRVVGDSNFCKSLAVVIWGTTVLKQRSVTGMKCNAKKTADAKPPLTPEKVSAIKECLSQRLKERGHTSEEINKRLLSVRKYLAEKISDINRIKTVSGLTQPQWIQ
ncbi:BEN domain-containing protein 5-like isoform X4 [Megalobrama amblycephala]|uniref:BEN domain-containing protein 5-like isoform X4 n=1 Tax=Megalobrama amblycephala TaxID=75352 RepID=UPI002014237D|nr:BEN domain-containing protein 5-like isoform X4 [Megalobrama amblycephala]